ncbi:MAG: AMP-binding protein [Methanobrevibacter sp.]|jgi:amino acid adenylation domain-containing protein|nr:AMP-binding protein [Candidatus Methanovirga australis]
MVVEDECENFFKKMLSLNETILPNDILKKEKEFNQVVFSLNLVFDNEYDDVFFLSGLLFTLTKFTYTRNVLISGLFKYHDDKALKFFEKIPFGIKINTNQNVEDFLSEVKSLTLKIDECKSHFSFFKRKNNLTSPDFQYIYKNDFSDIEIPESNFSIIFENSKKSRIKIKYNSSLYSDDFVELFYSSFVMILNKFYNEKKTLLKNISINPNIKKKTDVFKTLPVKSIGELFEKIVEKNEDKLALIANDTNLTYGELNREANCVANSLIKKGLKIEDRVIIDLNRDSKLIISILGVIKSGGTLILINSFLPKDRVSFIKLNTSPKYILTDDKMDSDDNNPEDDDSVINIDLLLNNECDDKNPSVNLKKDNVFSIIYTSGTTGIPKGVMLPHESMIKEIDDVHRFYNDDNFKTLIGLSVLFSGFIQSLLVELLSGVTVVLADDDVYRDPLKLYKTFKETDFNLIASTPSAIEMYLEFDILKEMIKQLKIIVLGGEKFGSNLVKKIHEVNSDINLFVGYGLTETFSANIKLLKPDGNINVGKPILNVVEIVVDIDGNPLPPGVLGELWIGGLNISKGYWRDEKLTKENFVKIDDITYFKTGDLAKYDESGEYTLFSRIDDQINIHGYRIEIGEIESNIPQNIGLKKSIATVKEINNEPTICLYFTTTIKLSKTKIDKLKNIIDNELKDKLPLFMVPRFYIQVDDFIFTQTGKVNAKGLPEPQPSDLISNQRMLSPETGIEKDLFNISSELLGHDNFGINSNFSSIGFSSLLLTKLLSYIFESYDVEINSRSLPLENTNIQNISEQIKKSSTIDHINIELKKHYLLTPQQYYFYKSKNYHHVPFHIKFNKGFDVYDLKSALIGTIGLNPYIKTTFEKIGSMIYQKINPHLVFNIPIYEKKLTNEIKKGFIKDFDLFEKSLFRFELYYYHDEVSLLMDIHHILIDNYGVEIFLNDLLDIYDNKKVNSKKFNYYDYSTEICDKKWKDETIKESKYFEKQLRKSSYKYLNDHYLNKKNSNNINKMDYNKSPSVVRDFHRIMLHFKGNFKKLSKKYNVSINQMILSAIIFSLGKMFDIDCLLINTTVDGRNSPKYYNTIGYFPYILPIFLNTNHETPMEYFNEVKKQTNIVMENYSPYFYPKKSDPLIIYNPTNLYKSNRFIKEGLESSLEELFPHIFSNSHVQYLYFLAALSDDEISLFLYFNTNYYSDNEIKELFKDINDFIGKIADEDEEIISKLYFSECDLLVNK